jgi:hypothetical protein
MVIRFGLIPGVSDRGRCGCTQSGPTKFDPWRPRRDSDPDLPACKSERPTVRLQGKLPERPVFSLLLVERAFRLSESFFSKIAKSGQDKD